MTRSLSTLSASADTSATPAAEGDELFAICIFLWTLPITALVVYALLMAAATPGFWVAFAVCALIAGVR